MLRVLGDGVDSGGGIRIQALNGYDIDPCTFVCIVYGKYIKLKKSFKYISTFCIIQSPN